MMAAFGGSTSPAASVPSPASSTCGAARRPTAADSWSYSPNPQFWYNVTPHLCFGSEIEVSSNFIYNTFSDKSFFINPTVAAKWNF